MAGLVGRVIQRCGAAVAGRSAAPLGRRSISAAVTAAGPALGAGGYRLPKVMEALARPTVAPVEEATVLHPAFYIDPAYVQAEQEVVFGKGWFAACYVAEVANPGDVKTIQIGNDSIVMTRDNDRKLHAFYNFRKLPTSPLQKERMPVPRLDTFAGIIWLNQWHDAPPLQEALGDLPQKLERYDMDELQLYGQKEYEVEGDWKLIAENFMDYYHINAVHPALANFSRVDDHYPYQGKGQYVGFVTAPLTDCGGPGDSHNFHPFPRLLPREASSGLFFHIFPNVSMAVFPQFVFTLIAYPCATPGKAKETASLFLYNKARKQEDSDDEFNEKCKKLLDFVIMTNDEDIDAIRNVQRGLIDACKRNISGQFLPQYDWTIHRFQNMVLNTLQGAPVDEAIMPSLCQNFERQVTGELQSPVL